MTKRFAFKKEMLFSFVIIILFFLGLEIISRVIWEVRTAKKITIVADMLLHHKWKANGHWIDRSGQLPFEMYTNSQSWIEKYDIQVKKPKNIYRIFYLGDSSTQGLVDSQYRMVEIISEKLKQIYDKESIKPEVINTGTSSYGIIQYYLIVKNIILPYQPDLVVIDVDMTDVPNDYTYKHCAINDVEGWPLAIPDCEAYKNYLLTPFGIKERSGILKLKQFLTREVKFLYYLDDLLSRFNKLKVSKKVKASKGDEANWLSLEYTDKINENINYSMKLLARTISMLTSRGIKVMITGAPHYPQFTGEWSWRPHEILAEVVSKSGAKYLNSFLALNPLVSGTKQNEYYLSGDLCHLNIKGNAALAKIHLEFLIKNELVPFVRDSLSVGNK